jgi:hypothetical protein
MKEKETIEQYVVSLIDILGQKNKLLELNSLNMKNDKQRIFDTFQDTYGKIKKFRIHMYEAMRWIDNITRKNNPKYDSNEIKISSFSDLITSYVSLRDDTNKVSFKGIYYLLFSNGLVFLQMLSEGSALRGGIDMGLGIEHQSDSGIQIYGSALSNPYHLESNIAIFPRLIVSNKLYQAIKNLADDNNSLFDDSISHNIHYAKLCMRIIKQDVDKEYIIDYLSEDFREMDNFQHHFQKAKEFIVSQLQYHEERHAVKEIKKYQYCMQYFKDNEQK